MFEPKVFWEWIYCWIIFYWDFSAPPSDSMPGALFPPCPSSLRPCVQLNILTKNCVFMYQCEWNENQLHGGLLRNSCFQAGVSVWFSGMKWVLFAFDCVTINGTEINQHYKNRLVRNTVNRSGKVSKFARRDLISWNVCAFLLQKSSLKVIFR